MYGPHMPLDPQNVRQSTGPIGGLLSVIVQPIKFGQETTCRLTELEFKARLRMSNS
jgi:hypothetical protein